MTERAQRLPGDFLLQPTTLALLALWLLNDHWLKHAHTGWISGKLSDVTSLALCPLLVLAAAEIGWPQLSARARRVVLLGAIAAVGLLMVGIKLWEPAAFAYRWGLALAQWPLRSIAAVAIGAPAPALQPVKLAMDPSDLLTLPSLWLAWAIGAGPSAGFAARHTSAIARTGVVLLALIVGCGSDGDGSPPGPAGDAAIGIDASRPPQRDGGAPDDARTPDGMDAASVPVDDGGAQPGSDAGDSGAPDAQPDDDAAGDGSAPDDDDGGDPDPDPDPDLDADDDGISDADEGRADGRDSDGDGTADYLDGDSDDDCRPDADEAGDAQLATAPVDTDLDGRPNARDLDSDGDHVTDESEDGDCDGALDAGETSALLADTDSDGASDLIEQVLGTDATSALDNPAANGDLVFLMPYQASPAPAQAGFELSTEVSALDVFFLMDTTGSMGGEVANLKSAFSGSLAAVADVIADVAVGVGGYEDFADAANCYGSAAMGDRPFYLLHRVMTAQTSTGLSSLQSAVNALTLHNGSDLPESGWQALFQIAEGSALTYNGQTVPAFDPGSAPPVTLPAGESVGTLGGVGFRAGALHAVVMITDASSHNSTAHGGDPAYGGAENSYGYGTCPAVPVAATKTQAIGALAALGVRVIGVASGGGSADAKPDLRTAVRATGAVVTPNAWDSGTRPAGCSATQCCTGLNGAGVAIDASGNCPLVYDVASTGAGLGSSFVDGLAGMVRHARSDVAGVIVDGDAGDAVDPASAFVDRIAARTDASGPCAAHTAQDSDLDGTPDRFVALQFGAPACFEVIAKPNAGVAQTASPQLFEAAVRAVGAGGEALGARPVYFVVPPAIDLL